MSVLRGYQRIMEASKLLPRLHEADDQPRDPNGEFASTGGSATHSGLTVEGGKPFINTSSHVADSDTLTRVPVTLVKGSDLKAGMVLVDPDFHTPAAELDQRVRATPGAGASSFMMHDFDTGAYTRASFGHNSSIKVRAVDK